MKIIQKHLEWFVFSVGLLMLAFMDPESAGTSLCFFEYIGIEFCPGEGLGHSISYTMKGNISEALNAHVAGPFAVIVLILRIAHILRSKLTDNIIKKENKDG